MLSSSQLLETEAAKRKPVGLASGGFCGFLEWPYFWGFRRLPEVPLLVNKKTSRVATGTHSNKHAACVGCRGHWGTPGADSSSRTVDPPHRCRWSTPASLSARCSTSSPCSNLVGGLPLVAHTRAIGWDVPAARNKCVANRPSHIDISSFLCRI